MNASKLTVGILFVVLASRTCMLAMADDVVQPSDASVHQADPPEHRVSLASVTVPVSDQTAPAPDQYQSTTPSCTKSQDDCLDGCCRPACNNPCPSVYGDVEAQFMRQEPRTIRQPIVVDPNTNTTFLSTSDLDFNFDSGLRATVGMRLWDDRALEFTYFGIFQGNASAVVVKPDPSAFLIFPGNLAGNVFVGMNRVQVNYSSWVHSFEVNLPSCCGCCDECGCCEARCRSYGWFAGFRYINLGEDFDITAQKIVTGATEQGTYNISTANNLYGAQLGGTMRRSQGKLGWEATGKAGIFGNDAQQRQSVIDFPNFPLRPTVSSSRGEVAFVGEIDLSVFYRLTDVWNLKVGYDLMWIENLALAPDQLDFNFASAQGGTQLHTGGGMFLHGVDVGLEARW